MHVHVVAKRVRQKLTHEVGVIYNKTTRNNVHHDELVLALAVKFSCHKLDVKIVHSRVVPVVVADAFQISTDIQKSER